MPPPCCRTRGTAPSVCWTNATGGDRLREFVTHGLDPEQRARIGPLPTGHGILGVLIDHPEPLRIDDLAGHPLSYGFPADHPP